MVRYRTLCLVNGPAPKCLRLVHGQGIAISKRLELTVANMGTTTWEPQPTIARNCRFPEVGTLCFPISEPWVTIAKKFRFPKVGTHGCQRGNHRLPLQRNSGSQRLELLVPNLGTTSYNRKELPVPRGWNSWFPTWEPQVTIVSNCWFTEVGTPGSQLRNQGLSLQAIAASQRLELMFFESKRLSL